MPSVSELKMFAGLGVDCVGMSSIPESLVAHHSGMKVFVIMTFMLLLLAEVHCVTDAVVNGCIRVKKVNSFG